MTTHGKHGHTIDDSMSTALRLLIHYCGDVHQPLHASTRVDKAYPSGDRGGNDFPLPNSLKELHAVWDSVMFEFSGYPKLPFNDADWDQNGKDAKRIMASYPKSSIKDVDSLDDTLWANESYEITKNFVYTGIEENKPLPSSYKTKGRKIAENRIATGGYRLAHLMKTIFGSAQEEMCLQ